MAIIAGLKSSLQSGKSFGWFDYRMTIDPYEATDFLR